MQQEPEERKSTPSDGSDTPARARGLRERIGEERWPAVRFVSLALIAALVLIPILFVLLRRSPGVEPSPATSRAINSQMEPTEQAAQPLPELWVQPTGQLTNQIPQQVLFHVSRTEDYTVEPGRVIPADIIQQSIKFRPEVSGTGMWQSANSFVYQFAESLQPGQRYDFQVESLPVSAQEVLQIEPKSFYFTTPEFELLSTALSTWSGAQLTLRIEMNLPVRLMGVEDSIQIRDNSGTTVEILHIERWQERGLEVTFTNTHADSYVLTLVEGLPASLGGVKLKQQTQVHIAIPKRELYVSRIVAEESGSGYAINVLANVQGSSECKLDRTVEKYVDLHPAVDYRVQYHSQGFRLVGDFLPDQTYVLTIRAGLSAGDALLRDNRMQSVTMPKPSPQVQFAVRGRYLGRNLGLKLPLQTRASEKLAISIWRLPPENLVWAADDPNNRTHQYGEPVVQRQEIELPEQSEADRREAQLTWIELNQFMDTSEPGVYRVDAERVALPDEERRRGYDYYRQTRDSATIVITDLALIAKRGKEHVWIWAVDARTGEPRSRVTVRLYSQKNVLLGTAITDSEGACEIGYESVRDRAPHLLTGTLDGDFTYLALGPGTLSLAPFSVSGIAPNEINYRAYFYPERNLYRPGETLHFATLLREEKTFRGFSLPVKVAVTDPRGKHITDLVQTTDEAGLAAFDLALPVTTPTGNYQFNVMVADRSAAYGNIFVETFVPERMSVQVTTDQEAFVAGEPVPFHIQADYLFGAPASEEHYRYFGNARESQFTARQFHDFHFGRERDSNKQPPTVEVKGEGTLDAQGSALAKCQIDDWSRFQNLVDLRISVEVEEAGSGRVSRGWTHVKVHPFPYYIGLKSSTRRITPGKPLKVQGVLVDHAGNPIPDEKKLRYEFYEIHHDYVRTWDPGRNRFSWEYTQQQWPVQQGTVIDVAQGRFEIEVQPATYWYDYLLEVRDETGASVSELTIRGWSWYGDSDRPESPELLDIQVRTNDQKDAATADEGDLLTAEVLLPFEGQVLWTLELDQVLEHQWQAATGDVARFEFMAPQGVTSAYVSALLIRSDAQYLVRRAFGVKRVSIRASKHRLPLSVTLPEHIRPGEELRVSLKGTPSMKATVAIVDEGILQITRFATPDVYEGILRDQALGVRTSESLGWIINKAMSKPGGSEEGSMALETPSLIRLVSHWSGVIEGDTSGNAEVVFPVPQYLGRLRVMVSAVDPTQMRSVERAVTVSTEVITMPTLPRFVIGGDQFEFPIALKNTTDQAQRVRLTTQVAEEPATEESLDLAPRASQVVWRPVSVEALSGVLEVLVRADWGTDQFEDTLAMPILPDRPFETEQVYLPIAAGETDLSTHVAGWLPDYHKMRITLTATPAVSQLHHVKHLIRYPYGCVEQTSSSLLPLVRMKELLETAVPDALPEGELANHVYAGIARLMSMQTPSGGFAFWPGGRDPVAWPSIYATFVLLEARDAGYLVPETLLDPALEYIERYARAEAFGYYVLGRAGRLRPGDLDEIIAMSQGQLASEQRLFLTGALQLGGRPVSAEKLLTDTLANYTPVKGRSYFGDLGSPLRNYGVRLYIRETLHPGSPDNEADAMTLVQMLRRQSRYYSTQELAWATLALGTRIANTTYAQNYSARLLADGKSIEPRRTEQGLIWYLATPPENIRLDVEADGALYAAIENSGFKRSAAYSTISKGGLTVEKRLLDLSGQPVTEVSQRELYFAELTVNNSRNEGLQNVALEDFIPAGFEIENPRLPGTATGDFLRGKPLFTPEYVDFRDERMQAFGYVPRGEVHYFYLLRAVTPGTFALPPVNAEVMYDPDIRASSGMGKVSIDH